MKSLSKQLDANALASVIKSLNAHDQSNRALQLWSLWLQEGRQLTSELLLAVLSSCTLSHSYSKGANVYELIQREGLVTPQTISAVIKMFALCGDITTARQVFHHHASSLNRDVVLYNSMIAAESRHGNLSASLELFDQLLAEKLHPSTVTFQSLLHACSHALKPELARLFYQRMTEEFQIQPTPEHNNLLVDALGRSGQLEEAEYFIHSLSNNSITIITWITLLGSCRTHHDSKRAKRVVAEIAKLDPRNAPATILLANTYAADGQYDLAAQLHQTLKDAGIKKIPGITKIEIDGVVHSFVANDSTHPDIGAIRSKVLDLNNKLLANGYIPDHSFVTKNVSNEEKNLQLCFHSERLAMAYGILRSPPSSPITITNNLRICGDCHEVTKLLSKIEKRVFIVGDANRFHRFENGRCSCNDAY